MAYMIWKKEYNLNISAIDKQHKKLFNIINEMQHAIVNGHGIIILERIFQQMTDYAEMHFSTEEEYFKKHSYAQTEEHLAEHNTYKQQLIKFKRSLDENKDISVYSRYLAVEVMKYLRKWWLEHICIEDKKYVNALISEQDQS